MEVQIRISGIKVRHSVTSTIIQTLITKINIHLNASQHTGVTLKITEVKINMHRNASQHTGVTLKTTEVSYLLCLVIMQNEIDMNDPYLTTIS